MSNDKKPDLIWIDEAQYFGRMSPAQQALFHRLDEKFKSLVKNSLETIVIDIDSATDLDAEIRARLVAKEDCMQYLCDGLAARLDQSICVNQAGTNHLVLKLLNEVRFLPIMTPQLTDFENLDKPIQSKGKVTNSGSKHKRNRWR